MDFVTIEFDRGLSRWAISELLDDPVEESLAYTNFMQAAESSKLRWDALDILQQYCFKVVYGEHIRGMMSPPVEGLRFLGVEARWGEYVAATQDQLVLGNPL